MERINDQVSGIRFFIARVGHTLQYKITDRSVLNNFVNQLIGFVTLSAILLVLVDSTAQVGGEHYWRQFPYRIC